MLISFFLNEMILRQFYFVYSDLSSISADLVVSPHSAHKPWTFAHDSRSISHSYTPVPTSTVRLDRRHFLIRHWFRHHLIRSSSLTCFGVLRPHDLRHCLIWVRPLILLPHSSSHLYRIGLRHRLIRSWSSSPTTCSHSPYRVIFTARVISSSLTSISSLSSLAMDLSRFHISDQPEAILREYARHRYVMKESRDTSARAVLSQLPSDGPYSRENVGLLFTVIGEFTNDGHFLSEMRLLLPTLAIPMDGTAAISGESW